MALGWVHEDDSLPFVELGKDGIQRWISQVYAMSIGHECEPTSAQLVKRIIDLSDGFLNGRNGKRCEEAETGGVLRTDLRDLEED